MGFEPTIPASERAKTVHASDRAATVTGCADSNTRFYYQLTTFIDEIHVLSVNSVILCTLREELTLCLQIH
jgi:hypothetical protein